MIMATDKPTFTAEELAADAAVGEWLDKIDQEPATEEDIIAHPSHLGAAPFDAEVTDLDPE